MFHCKWIRFYDMNWKEKIDLINETFSKNEMWLQNFDIKFVKNIRKKQNIIWILDIM